MNMKWLNGIFGIALVFMFACGEDDPIVDPQNNGTTNLNTSSNVSESAQDVLQIEGRMQALESIGFGRPSILSRGFGFEETSSLFSGRVRDDEGPDNDQDDEEWEDWELDEETMALLEKIEALEQEIDSLDLQIDFTEDEQKVADLENTIEELEEEIEQLEEQLDEKIEAFEEEHGEFYIEDCEHTSCAQEEFTENSDGSFTWVLDYGDGCEEYDGTVLKGKIIETFTDDENGFSGTIVYENFGESDGDEEYIINGTETFSGSFESDDDDEERGSYTYSESLQITVDGETFTVTGSGTETFDSLGYTLEGKSRYEASNGDFAETEITTPLYFSHDCENDDVFEPVSGVEETTYNEGGESGDFVIDFGSGTCDNIITITENGETYQIDLEEEDWDEDDEDDEDDDGDDDDDDDD